MTAARWENLAEFLSAEGFEAKVTAKPYSQSSYGRIEHGVSRSINLRVNGQWICIADHWTKHDIWTGWLVYLEDAEGITVAQRDRIKKRTEILEAVREFAARVAA